METSLFTPAYLHVHNYDFNFVKKEKRLQPILRIGLCFLHCTFALLTNRSSQRNVWLGLSKCKKEKNIKNLQIALSGSFVVHLKSEKNPFRFVTHPLSLSLFFSFYLYLFYLSRSFLLTLILFFYLSILLFFALSIFFILTIFLFLILVLSSFSISSLSK